MHRKLFDLSSIAHAVLNTLLDVYACRNEGAILLSPSEIGTARALADALDKYHDSQGIGGKHQELAVEALVASLHHAIGMAAHCADCADQEVLRDLRRACIDAQIALSARPPSGQEQAVLIVHVSSAAVQTEVGMLVNRLPEMMATLTSMREALPLRWHAHLDTIMETLALIALHIPRPTLDSPVQPSEPVSAMQEA